MRSFCLSRPDIRTRSVAVALLFVLASLGGVACGQAVPTASREPIEAGAAFSFGSPDYQNTMTYVEGLTVFADAPLRGRLAADFDMHYDSLHTPIDIGQNTYLLGPRFSVAREDRANVYVKALGGLGQFEYQKGVYSNPHAETYGVVAFGGGIEYRLSPRWTVRAVDLEYQIWPGFGAPGLHPVVASLGMAYTF